MFCSHEQGQQWLEAAELPCVLLPSGPCSSRYRGMLVWRRGPCAHCAQSSGTSRAQGCWAFTARSHTGLTLDKTELGTGQTVLSCCGGQGAPGQVILQGLFLALRLLPGQRPCPALCAFPRWDVEKWACQSPSVHAQTSCPSLKQG